MQCFRLSLWSSCLSRLLAENFNSLSLSSPSFSMQSESSTLFRIRRPRFPHPRSQFAHPLHAGFTRGRPPPPPRPPPPLTTYRLSDGRAEAAAAGCEGGRGRRSGGGPGGVPASEVGDTPPAEAGAHTSPPVCLVWPRSLSPPPPPSLFSKGGFSPKN